MEKVMIDLKHLLEEELRKIVKKNDISPVELENATKAVCLMQKVQELEDWPTDEEMEQYYSRRSHPMSYRRGRDAMTGRYVSRDYRGPSHYDYMPHSYETEYSGHSVKDRMIATLESMMDAEAGDYEKKTIHEWIEKLEMGV